MAGRPRKPLALKVLQRTDRRDRANLAVPKLPVRSVSYPAPDWLTPAAQAEWTRLEPVLRGAGILTEGDTGIFANYCSRYAAALKADGLANTARSPKAFAYWDGFARKSWEAMSRAAQQLGLTPAAREKVSAIPLVREPANPFGSLDVRQKFFGRRGRA